VDDAGPATDDVPVTTEQRPTTPATPATPPADGPPPWVLRLASLTIYVGVVGFVIAEIVQYAQSGTDGFLPATFANALVWVVGVNAIICGSGHIVMPGPVAESIGWPKGSPFQFEVGLANLGIGVLGVLSPSFDRDFALAVVIAFSIFYFGAALGHVREMISEHDTAPGNAGFIFWFDVIAPPALIALYLAT
jgi:hypothetical protein